MTGKIVVCLGTRVGLLEDGGCAPGYENVVEEMAEPQHRERERLSERLGNTCHPEGFSLSTPHEYRKRRKIQPLP